MKVWAFNPKATNQSTSYWACHSPILECGHIYYHCQLPRVKEQERREEEYQYKLKSSAGRVVAWLRGEVTWHGGFTSGSHFWWPLCWCGDQVSTSPRIRLLAVTITEKLDMRAKCSEELEAELSAFWLTPEALWSPLRTSLLLKELHSLISKGSWRVQRWVGISLFVEERFYLQGFIFDTFDETLKILLLKQETVAFTLMGRSRCGHSLPGSNATKRGEKPDFQRQR